VAQAAPPRKSRSPSAGHRPVRLELGYGLLPLINERQQAHHRPDQVAAPPDGADMGFVMPAVRILDNMQLGANEYASASRRSSGQGRTLRPASCWSWIPARRADRCRASPRANRPSACPRCGSRTRLREEALVPRLHRGRSRHRHHHAPDRDREGQYGRAAVLRRNAEAARRPATRNSRSWSPTSSRRRSPSPASSACCRTCWPNASRSATCRRSWKASPKPAPSPAIVRMITEHVRARLARQISTANERRDQGAIPLVALSPVGAGIRRVASSVRATSASSPWRPPPAGLHHRGAPELRALGDARGDPLCC
jgi:hypothetical protein